jgi:formyl-CoA transferase
MAIPKQPFEPDREGPLRGVRVLDFSRLVAGNIQDPAFKTNTERVKRRAEVDAIVGGFIKQRTLADAVRFFEEALVTAAPVYDIGQFLEDPHVQERGIVVEVPDDEMGDVPMHAIVPRLSDTPGRLRCPAPAVGQHNREIFSRIGYSDERIAALAQKGVI